MFIMDKLSDIDLRALLEYLEQAGQDPNLMLTKELKEKINLISAMNRAGRVAMAKDGSVAIGGDANRNTFNLGPVIQLSLQDKPLLEEIIAIHNFDLTELIDDCLDHLLINPQGIVGFGLPCNIPKLLPSVCERLKNRLNCDCAGIKDHIVLDRSYAASIDEVVNDFLLTHKVAKIQNTIFSVQTFENESALSFWHDIKSKENHIRPETRLILLMIVEGDFPFPPDIFKLPPPRFRPAHVQDFFMKVVSTRKQEWENAIILRVVGRWVQSLINYCTTDEVLYQRDVYHYLNMTLDEFKGNTDPDLFLGFLEEIQELA